MLYYGYDNFRLDILATIPNNPTSGLVSIESKGELVKLEQYYLDLLDPDYNILKVAYSLKGYVHTEETKVKLKASAALLFFLINYGYRVRYRRLIKKKSWEDVLFEF